MTISTCVVCNTAMLPVEPDQIARPCCDLRARISRSVEAPSTNPVALADLSRQLVLISKELSVLGSDGDDDVIAEAARTPDEDWTAV